MVGDDTLGGFEKKTETTGLKLARASRIARIIKHSALGVIGSECLAD
ncbi:MAG: hypothetical protein AB8B99_07100 [Phormidesmis sp.]